MHFTHAKNSFNRLRFSITAKNLSIPASQWFYTGRFYFISWVTLALVALREIVQIGGQSRKCLSLIVIVFRLNRLTIGGQIPEYKSRWYIKGPVTVLDVKRISNADDTYYQ